MPYRHRWRWLATACLLVTLVCPPIASAAPMRLVHRGPESDTDARRQYDWVLLRIVLDKTRERAGPFELVESPVPMNSARALTEMIDPKGKINIFTRGTSITLEQQLRPIRIPIERGIRGYRLFLIRDKDQPRFSGISDRAGLGRFVYGLGKTWVDVDVMENAGLHVEQSSAYASLFPMLVAGRFDAFPRGLDEIYSEYELYRNTLPTLAVEQDVALYYPLPRYFFVRRDAEGEQLARRIEAGLELMVRDGSLKALFWRFHGDFIRRAKLDRRHLVRLSNPKLPPGTPLNRSELWFDPATEH